MRTGIPVSDDWLGEIPTGKTLMYFIDPEIEGDVFAMQSFVSNLEEGYNCAFVVTTMSPKTLRTRFREFGWDIDEFANKSIIDAYSPYVGSFSEEEYIVDDPTDLKMFDKVICSAIQDNDLLIFSSLSTIMDICGENIFDYIGKWGEFARDNDCVIIYSFTNWSYPKAVVKKLNELSNTVVNVGGIHHRVILGQYYGIVKSDWSEIKKKSVLFRMARPGGIKAYIPKILVTGPYNAGKTTFIHNISAKSVSVERFGTTIALDHGHVEHRNFSIDVFGSPGQERFDPLLKMLGEKALGVVLIVDSTAPDTFPRAKEMLSKTTRMGLPYVIAANKQDLDSALGPEEIRERMSLPDETVIIPITANYSSSIVVIDYLIDMLVGD